MWWNANDQLAYGLKRGTVATEQTSGEGEEELSRENTPEFCFWNTMLWLQWSCFPAAAAQPAFLPS